MRQGGIEEDIELNAAENNNMTIDESQRKGAEIDPNDTCTSDFYQVPIQGGIPV